MGEEFAPIPPGGGRGKGEVTHHALLGRLMSGKNSLNRTCMWRQANDALWEMCSVSCKICGDLVGNSPHSGAIQGGRIYDASSPSKFIGRFLYSHGCMRQLQLDNFYP